MHARDGVRRRAVHDAGTHGVGKHDAGKHDASDMPPALMRSAMPTTPPCPQCTLTNTYLDGPVQVCADCGHEWTMADEVAAEAAATVRDCNGTVLAEGDTVVVIKDLKVKGSSIPLKQGTVIRHIRLVEGDAGHIEGHSDKIKGLVLKTCFLRKA